MPSVKKYLLALLSAAALTQSALSFADYVPSPMPQGTPPQIDESVKQLIRSRIQKSPVLPKEAESPAVASLNTTSSADVSRSAMARKGTAADNMDNQRAYHDKIKQYLRTQNK